MELLRRELLTPSKEELSLIENLKEDLNEHLLLKSISISEQARNSIAKFLTDDILLLKYIRGRKHNIQRAHDSIIRYAEVSCDIYPDLFADKVPDKVRCVFDKQILTVLRHTDRHGRIILYNTATAWDTSEISIYDVICAGRFIIDGLMEYPCLYDNGAVLVVNGADVQLSHVKQYTIPAVMKFINVFWQSYPIPIKGMYYVNLPFFAKPVYAILKPFLPSKLRERILISSNMRELHNRIPVDILPEALGGMLSGEEAFSLSFLELPE